MITNNRMSLRLDKKIVAELKQKALSEGKTISQFITDSKDYFDFELNDDVFFRIDYIDPIKPGSDIYRINVFFRESESRRLLRPLWYEIWVSEDCVEDSLHTPNSPTKSDFAEFAFRFISKRYKESGNMLPSEFGAFLLSGRTDKYANDRHDLWIWYDEASSE